MWSPHFWAFCLALTFLVLGLLDLALSLALGSLALGSWLLGLTLLWFLGLGLVELVLEVVLVEHSGFLQWITWWPSWWPSWQSAHKSISQLQGCWIIYPTSLQAADANVYPGTAVATMATMAGNLAWQQHWPQQWLVGTVAAGKKRISTTWSDYSHVAQ